MKTPVRRTFAVNFVVVVLLGGGWLTSFSFKSLANVAVDCIAILRLVSK